MGIVMIRFGTRPPALRMANDVAEGLALEVRLIEHPQDGSATLQLDVPLDLLAMVREVARVHRGVVVWEERLASPPDARPS